MVKKILLLLLALSMVTRGSADPKVKLCSNDMYTILGNRNDQLVCVHVDKTMVTDKTNIRLVSVKEDGVVSDAFVRENAVRFIPDSSALYFQFADQHLRKWSTLEATVAVEIAASQTEILVVKFAHPVVALAPAFPTLKIVVVGSEVQSATPLVISGYPHDFDTADWNDTQPYFEQSNNTHPFTYRTSAFNAATGRLNVGYALDSGFLESIPHRADTFRGTLKIRADRHSPEVEVRVAITRRKHKWLIIILLAAGLLVAALIRFVLEVLKLKGDATVSGSERKELMLLALENIEDKTMIDKVRALMNSVDAALAKITWRTVNLTTFNRELDLISAKFNEIKTEFDAGLKTVADELQKYRVPLEFTHLISALDEKLVNAKQLYRDARQYLVRGNLTEASDILPELRLRVRDVMSEIQRAPKDLAAALAEGKLTPKTLKTLLEDFKTAFTVILLKFDAIPGETDPNQIQQADDALKVQAYNIGLLIARAEEAKTTFLAQPASQAVLGAFELAFIAWKQELQALAQDPFRVFNLTIVKTLEDNFAQLVPPGQPGLLKVASLAANASTPNQSSSMGKRQQPFIGGKTVLLPTLQDIHLAMTAAGKLSIVAFILQFIFLLLILTLTMFKTYQAGFVGDENDLITLFLAGFAADITLDKLLQFRPVVK